MKKITLSFLISVITLGFTYGQLNLTAVAPPYQNTFTQLRAPNGTVDQASMRGCFIVQASELTDLVINAQITSFGFSLTAGTPAISVPGNFTLYIQNTANTTYQKGTSWPTVLTGMTTAYTGPMTVPSSPSATTIILPLSPNFVYNGGGLYVAYDWSSAGPFDPNPASYAANNSMTTGGASSEDTTAVAPSILNTTSFRPVYIFNATNTSNNEVQVLDVIAAGKVTKLFNTPQTISALVRNASAGALSNIAVGLGVSGANTFADNVIIPSLAAGASAMVSFNPFNPQTLGLNTISVSVLPDDNNANNLVSKTQSVTCNYVAANPPAGSYSAGVGFDTGGGLISYMLTPPVSVSLTGVRLAVSTDGGSVGHQMSGVLMDNTGNILATTNTLNLNASMGGVFQNLSFNPPQTLSAGTDYYIGMDQEAITSGTTGYFPLGSQTSYTVPSTIYYTSPAGGGAVTPLTTNLGYLGIEPVLTFDNTFISVVGSRTVMCKGESITLIVSGGSTSYTWSPSAGGSNSTTVVLSPTTTTSYTVQGTDGTTGCKSNVVSIVQPVAACTGLLVNGLNGSGIRLFPNPAVDGKSTVSGLDGQNTIQVFNILGMMILTQQCDQENTTLDLSSHPNGTYLVKITDANTVSKTIKIVNQN